MTVGLPYLYFALAFLLQNKPLAFIAFFGIYALMRIELSGNYIAEYCCWVFLRLWEYGFISYSNYRIKKDYNRYSHSPLRIEKVPFLFVCVCRPSALSYLT